MKMTPSELPLMEVQAGAIVLCHPHIPSGAIEQVAETLRTRWIGQGPKVELFEKRFSEKFAARQTAIAVGSGTDALHLAYILADISDGDEVIAPVFTCTATNIPLLYQRAKVIFADVQRTTLNIDVEHVRALVNERTKAIVCVPYGGLPCDMDELCEISKQFGIPLIVDAAHALGARYKGNPIACLSDFTMFSFQAIKHITTGDGGMLIIRDGDLTEKAKRIRWFGIDRSAKQKGIWENDITELGYKYQMNDISAAMGLAALEDFPKIYSLRKKLLAAYESNLAGIPGISMIGAGYTDREHAAWLCTVLVEDRRGFQKKLREHQIESNQMHYRNDRYSVFGGRRHDLPNMDLVEDTYVVIPLHTKMTIDDVERVCAVIRSGW